MSLDRRSFFKLAGAALAAPYLPSFAFEPCSEFVYCKGVPIKELVINFPPCDKATMEFVFAGVRGGGKTFTALRSFANEKIEQRPNEVWYPE